MSCLLIGTFIARVLFASFIVLAAVSYVFEFGQDQHFDFGVWADIWAKHVTNEKLNYPGHRNQPVYIILFLLVILFSLLAIVALCFENKILLAIVLPAYLVIVITDFILIGKSWAKLGFWSGPCTITFGILVCLVGTIYLVLLYIRGPSTLAAVFADEDDEDEPAGGKTTANIKAAKGKMGPSGSNKKAKGNRGKGKAGGGKGGKPKSRRGKISPW